jgi:hypothetical protein
METSPSSILTRGRFLFLGIALVLLASPSVMAQTFEWATVAGGVQGDRSIRTATDAANFVYVVGSFRDQAHFGSQVVTSKGDSDIFLARY